jgi:hypothetical protein
MNKMRGKIQSTSHVKKKEKKGRKKENEKNRVIIISPSSLVA